MKKHFKYLFMTVVTCMSLLFSLDEVSAKGGFYSSISQIYSVVVEQSYNLSTLGNLQLDSAKKNASTSATNLNDKSSKSNISWLVQPFKNQSNTQNTTSVKLISNVKVFPNPVVESINLSFRLSKRADISIKVMDALGNEIMTLLNQTLDSGNQNHSFELNGKLTTGVYFVRINSGAESIVKRVSVV